MNLSKSGIILTLFISLSLISGCGSEANSNRSNSAPPANQPKDNPNAAKTNVEELGLLVNVPYDAEDIVWKENAARNKVTAVFRFSTADANKLVAEAEKFGPGENVSVPVETWFPDELTAQGDMSGDSALKGVAYPANAFYQEPYNKGKITRIEGGDYFVLELTSK